MQKREKMKVDYNDHIIHVKLMNVEKNALYIGKVFKVLAQVNIDMISQVMLEDEVRIDLTCDQSDQALLNQAIEIIKKEHPRLEVYQNRQVAKVMIEDQSMKNEAGIAAQLFELFGKCQIPLLQVTTSEVSISYVIPKDNLLTFIEEMKKIER